MSILMINSICIIIKFVEMQINRVYAQFHKKMPMHIESKINFFGINIKNQLFQIKLNSRESITDFQIYAKLWESINYQIYKRQKIFLRGLACSQYIIFDRQPDKTIISMDDRESNEGFIATIKNFFSKPDQIQPLSSQPHKLYPGKNIAQIFQKEKVEIPIQPIQQQPRDRMYKYSNINQTTPHQQPICNQPGKSGIRVKNSFNTPSYIQSQNQYTNNSQYFHTSGTLRQPSIMSSQPLHQSSIFQQRFPERMQIQQNITNPQPYYSSLSRNNFNQTQQKRFSTNSAFQNQQYPYNNKYQQRW